MTTCEAGAREVTAFLGLGANLGDRAARLRWAVRELDQHPALRVVATASLYGSKPVGVTDQPDFLNTVVEVRTSLPPLDLLRYALELERRAGRVRTRRWGPRTLDIDLLWYDGRVIRHEPELVVPHPRVAERAFVLVPWAEIAPRVVVPGLGTVAELCRAVDRNGVWLEQARPWTEEGGQSGANGYDGDDGPAARGAREGESRRRCR
ncbi:MAG TPA: 2-amino-4-hydroxy-6-hydroxymethyldihydropteridine diphosphokinase [Thermaerobacter sp.]